MGPGGYLDGCPRTVVTTEAFKGIDRPMRRYFVSDRSVKIVNGEDPSCGRKVLPTGRVTPAQIISALLVW